MKTFLRACFVALIITTPTAAFAEATAAIGALSASTVGVGSPVTFGMIVTGFTNPSFKVVDSFPGGVTSVNMDAWGTFSWIPNKDDLGSHTITVTVTDSGGNSASAATTISVVAPSVTNTSPSPASTVRFGNPVTFTISASGFMSPTYSVTDGFLNSTLSLYNTRENGSFTWTPSFQDIGTHKLLITARDYRNTATSSQTITVLGLPNLTIENISPSKKIAVGETVSFDAVATGMLSPQYSFQDATVSGTTSNMQINAQGHFTWTPHTAEIGTHLFTVSATNTAQDSATAQTSITVVAATPGAPKTTPTTTQLASTTSKTAAGRYTFTKDLALGSRGAEVTALQQKLAALGFLKSEPTGYFGAMTKQAVQAFQKSMKLPQLGRVGPATRAALNSL